MNLITVNQAIIKLDSFNEKYLYIEGMLHFEFENTSIEHWSPNSSENNFFNHARLWINVSWKAISYNKEELSKWQGQRVVVYGRLRKPTKGGAGHLGCFRASVFVTQIELFKTWQSKNGE